MTCIAVVEYFVLRAWFINGEGVAALVKT